MTASDQAPAGARIESLQVHQKTAALVRGWSFFLLHRGSKDERSKKSTSEEVLFSMKRTLRCMKSEARLCLMKRGFAARRGAGASLHASAASASRKPQVPASRLPTANASLPVLQLYTAVVREIAAVTSGFYFTFCGAENFTTTERLFHILHMQNIPPIFLHRTSL